MVELDSAYKKHGSKTTVFDVGNFDIFSSSLNTFVDARTHMCYIFFKALPQFSVLGIVEKQRGDFMAKLTHCKVCGTELSNGAKICPQCGQPRRKPFYRRIWFILLVIIVALNAVRSFNAARNERLHEQNGYGIFTLSDGSNVTAKDIQSLYNESAVAANNTYVGQTVTVTMEVTSIDSWYIEDYTGRVRFSCTDYVLHRWDYQKLSDIRVGDIVKVTGTIEGVIYDFRYVQLTHITSIDRIAKNA